jgi:Flp pilus assembly protein TadG
MTQKAGQFWRGTRSETGASAIEFALILPIFILLYTGMIDVTHYVSAARKVANAANILSDITTQQTTVITAAAIDDAFTGAKLAMKPIAAGDISLEVRNYRRGGEKIANHWSRKTASGPGCQFSDTSDLASLMTAQNDIIIAAVCTEYEPFMSKIFNVFGVGKLHIETGIKLRPRESNMLDCSGC